MAIKPTTEPRTHAFAPLVHIWVNRASELVERSACASEEWPHGAQLHRTPIPKLQKLPKRLAEAEGTERPARTAS